MIFAYYSLPGLWTEDITGGIRLGRIPGLVTEAELGAVGTCSQPLDDPLATLGHNSDGIAGLKSFWLNETAAPSGKRRVFGGYTADRHYARGQSDSPSLIQGVSRVIDLSLVDHNARLGFRTLVNAPDGNNSFDRPAETDLARVAALLAVPIMSGIGSGLVAGSGGFDMDANDYTGQHPVDVLNDCAQQSGRNFFLWYDEAGDYGTAGAYVLFYHFNDDSVLTTTMRVSNVKADVDSSTTWWPLIDGELTRSPERVYAGAYGSSGKTTVYRRNAATADSFVYRDIEASSPNLSTSTKITARLDRYLDENDTEDDRLTFGVLLPAANVNDWRAGQLGQVKFQHLPGYTTFQSVRCLQRTVMQTDETEALYVVRYEVGTGTGAPPYESRGLGTGGGEGSPFYAGQPPCYSTPIAYTGQVTVLSVSSTASDRSEDSSGTITVPGGFGLRVASWTFTPGTLTSIRGILESIDTVSAVQKVVGEGTNPFRLQSSGGGVYSMPSAFSGTYAYSGGYAPGSAGNNPGDASTSVTVSGLSGDIWRNVTCTPQTIYLRGENNPEFGASGTWTVTCSVAVVP